MYRNVGVFDFDTMRYKLADAGRFRCELGYLAGLRGPEEGIVSDCISAARSYIVIQKMAVQDTSAIHAGGFLELTI